MASNYTNNYNLCQWQPSDKVLRTEFNQDNAKIDAALAAKADRTALSSLTSTMSGKASQSALDSLSAIVSGHTGTLLKKGNCQICTSSYTGNGATTPKTVTFPGKPLLVVFAELSEGSLLVAAQGMLTAHTRTGTSSSAVSVSWSGNSVSLTASGAGAQMNYAGRSYFVLALTAADA